MTKSKKYSIPKEAPKLALVVWEDAVTLGETEWGESKAQKYSPQLFWQVGFITLDTKEGLHLVEAWSPDFMSQSTQIPRGMIRKLTYLS